MVFQAIIGYFVWLNFLFRVKLHRIFYPVPRGWVRFQPNFVETTGNVLLLPFRWPWTLVTIWCTLWLSLDTVWIDYVIGIVVTLDIMVLDMYWIVMVIRILFLFSTLGFSGLTYACVGLVFLVGNLLRALGRYFNQQYMDFLNVLIQAHANPNNGFFLTPLRGYDFLTKFWPEQLPSEFGIVAFLCVVLYPFTFLFSYLLILPMYPGILPWFLARLITGVNISATDLRNAKDRLEEDNIVEEFKVTTSHGASISGLFIDNRATSTTLVICCEGNYTFAEMGAGTVPILEGYSVLTYNRPSYGDSTGIPFPEAECAAAQEVYEYAVNALGFEEKAILVYGYSIGGYPAAYLATMHANIKGLVLDATFTDILPLVLERVPWGLKTLVTCIIRNHIDLRLIPLLRGFRGPILFIRRTTDNMMQTDGEVSTNMINDLVIDVLESRYPILFDAVSKPFLVNYLSTAHNIHGNGAINVVPVRVTPNKIARTRNGRSVLLRQVAANVLFDFAIDHGDRLRRNAFTIPIYPTTGIQ